MTRTHVLDLGKLLIHHHHVFSKIDAACTQSKMGMVACLGGVHTVSAGIRIIHLCVTNITSNIRLNHSIQTVWRVDWKGIPTRHNLCGDCARPTDERSLVRSGGGYNQASYVYITKGCVGWVSGGLMEWVEWMWRVALFLVATEARPSGTCQTGSL